MHIFIVKTLEMALVNSATSFFEFGLLVTSSKQALEMFSLHIPHHLSYTCPKDITSCRNCPIVPDPPLLWADLQMPPSFVSTDC